MAKKKEGEIKVVGIHPLNKKELVATIVGDTSLLIHKLSTKLKIEFESKALGKSIPKNKTRDPKQEYCDSLYWLDKNGNEIEAGTNPDKHNYWGFPASGLKQACISACRAFKEVKMTEVKGAFHIVGKFIRIEGKSRIQQGQGCDGVWVRIGGKGAGTGTPDIRYRAEFPAWKATIKVQYNANVISAEQILNLINTSGFSVGLGEDRPERKGGSNGMYHVA
jgi:hypothetical protein